MDVQPSAASSPPSPSQSSVPPQAHLYAPCPEGHFAMLPLEMTLNVVHFLAGPAYCPVRGDLYGGPYEAGIESAVSLIRLTMVRLLRFCFLSLSCIHSLRLLNETIGAFG